MKGWLHSMKNQFKSIDEVWKAIDAGQTVYWMNDSYQLTIEDSNLDWRQGHGFAAPFSNRNDKCLRITCISNWFGSLLDRSELGQLYTK